MGSLYPTPLKETMEDIANMAIAEVTSNFEQVVKELTVRIKYLDGSVEKISKIENGDWIDLYAAEDVTLKKGEFALIHLGVAMEIPEGYEVHLAPRSSTFKKWGIIQTNSVGVIDQSYCGDNDWWKLPVLCMAPRDKAGLFRKVTHIKKGDKIAQFRLVKKMPEIIFNEVTTLGNTDRGGFGSTGSSK